MCDRNLFILVMYWNVEFGFDECYNAEKRNTRIFSIIWRLKEIGKQKQQLANMN